MSAIGIYAGIALFVSIGGYIAWLRFKGKRAERQAASARRERDNAVVKQEATSMAQGAEQAYQDAQDAPRRDDKDVVSAQPESKLDKLNRTFPAILLCLLLGACASTVERVVMVNPAEQVVVPPMHPMEAVQFTQLLGEDGQLYCLDGANADALKGNIGHLKRRITGLENAMRKLGAEVR